MTIIDCIDKERSKLVWNEIEPDRIASVYRLVLQPERIPSDIVLYRPQHYTGRILANPAFARKRPKAAARREHDLGTVH